MNSIELLLKRLNDEQIIQKLVIPQNDIVESLDQRDNDEFSSRWMQAFQDVESKKSREASTFSVEASVSSLRESSFLQAFDRWNSPDLAAYISDDFGLIGDAIALDLNDGWINGLLHCYLTGLFPNGDIPEIHGNLASLI